MARINTTENTRADTAFALLESDVYKMVIKRADLEPDQFAEPNDAGVYPDKLVLCWEVYEAAPDQDDEVVGLSVWQRIAPWYGDGKRGASQFKLLLDSLIEQGLLPEATDPSDFETDDLVGIKQRLTIEQYTKSMGINKGQPGNRVVGKPLPISRKRQAPPSAPPSAPPAQRAPARRNVPTAVTDDDMPF